jgi:hypothetical protein
MNFATTPAAGNFAYAVEQGSTDGQLVRVTITNTVPGSPIGTKLILVCGAPFRQRFTLEDAIELHTFAPLEALPCV